MPFKMISSGGASLSASQTAFLYSASAGALLATLNDPYVGLGLGATTYTAYGAAPGQLALSGATINKGATAAVSGAAYSIGVEATSGDGKRRIGETITLQAQPQITLSNVTSYSMSTTAGTKVADIAGVPAGATPSLSPNDGRMVIAGNATDGWEVVVGLSASSVGMTLITVSAAGALPSVGTPVTVSNIAPYLGQVATRSYFPNAVANTAMKGQFRSPHVATDNISALQVEYPAFFINNTDGTYTPSASNLTYQAAVEYPEKTVIGTIKWGGSSTGNAAAGATTGLSDVCTLSDTIPGGARFWLTPYVVGTANGSIPTYKPASGRIKDTANGEKCAFGSTVTNNSQSPASIVDDGNQVGLYPLWIVAQTKKPTFLIVGDSQGAGSGATPNVNGDTGTIAQSIGVGGCAYINGSIGGYWNKWAAQNAALWFNAKQYVSHVILEIGANDLYSAQRGGTASQLKGSMQTLASFFWDKPCIGTTILPVTGGTFTSPGGQTLDSGNTERLSYNAFMRTMPYPFAAILDVAAQVEDPINPGKWISTGGVAISDDGLHANNVGLGLITSSGVINPAALGALPNVCQLWTPVQLGVGTTSVVSWIDASNYNQFKSTPDGSQVDNAIANLGGLTQSTVANQPTFTPDAIGGLPALVFAGLGSLGAGQGGRSFSNAASAITTLFVGAYHTVTANSFPDYISTGSNSSAARASISIDASGHLITTARRLDTDTGINTPTTVTPGIDNPFLFVASFDATNGIIENRLNGTVDGTAVYSTTGNIQSSTSLGATIGGGGFNGRVGERINIMRSLTIMEKQKLEGYAAWKWGLVTNLPSDHPYKSVAP